MRREQIFWKKLISLILCVVMALSQGGLALLAQAELPVGVAGVNDDNPPVTLNVYGEDSQQTTPDSPPVLGMPAVVNFYGESYSWTGAGTSAEPYEVNELAALLALAEEVNSGQDKSGIYYKLTADIDLSAWTEGDSGQQKSWTPIGSEANPFNGIFDGNGKTVKNLLIGSALTPVTESNQGFFGYIGGTVKKLTVTGGIYSEGDNIGGIAGYFRGALLEDCVFGAEGGDDFVRGKDNVGGIVGYAAKTISSGQKNFGAVQGNRYVGGIVGNHGLDYFATRGDVINRGKIEGTAYVGGIAGGIDGIFYPQKSSGSLEMSNNGEITGESSVGGLVGQAKGIRVLNDGKVSLLNTGAVTGENKAGGIAGELTGVFTISDRGGSEVVNKGAIKGQEAVGGIVGEAQGEISVQDSSLINQGAVDASADNAGGIAGLAYGDIRSYGTGTLANQANITAIGNNAGGIAGQVAVESAEKEAGLEKVFSSGGIIKAGENAGGLVGLFNAGGTIIDSFSHSAIDSGASGSALGGLAGRVASDEASVKYCYSTGSKEGSGDSLPLVGAGAPAVKSSYSLASDAHSGDDAAKGEEFFVYGAVACLLDKTEEGARRDVWGQKLGTDDSPALLSDEHPKVYRISVTPNLELSDVVKSVSFAPAEADAWRAFGQAAYANAGMRITLRAAGLARDNYLRFIPTYRVELKETQDDFKEYALTVAEKDEEFSYEQTVAVPGDTSWYQEEGTSFRVEDEADLVGLAELVKQGQTFAGKVIALSADIVLTSTDWSAIGTEEYPFSGSFIAAENDTGGYYSVTGVNIQSDRANQGFFGYLKNAKIENLSVGGKISGGTNIGAIAGAADNSTLINCVNIGEVSGQANGGGVLGRAGEGTVLESCGNEGTVTGADQTGGVAGTFAKTAKMTGCYNGKNGTVEGQGTAGGVIGELASQHGATAPLADCYNLGIVRGKENAGGVIGSVTQNLSAISGLYNAGKVYGTGEATNTGGVIGRISGRLKTMGGQITGLYNQGLVDGGQGQYTGGVFGYVGPGMGSFIRGCYNDISGNVVSAGQNVGGVMGMISAAAMPPLASTPGYCYNLGTVKGAGSETYAAGIAAELWSSNAYVVNCYNYGRVESGAASRVGAISAVLGQQNANRQNFYKEDSIFVGEEKAIPADEAAVSSLTAKEFAIGRAAYLLDSGDTTTRTLNWGMSENGYPVLADGDHPPVYRLELEVKELTPEQTPDTLTLARSARSLMLARALSNEAPKENRAGLDGDFATAAAAIDGYKNAGKTVTVNYELKEGSAFGRVEVTAADGVELKVIMGERLASGGSFSFVMPADGQDVTAIVYFIGAPLDPLAEFTVTFEGNGGVWQDNATRKNAAVLAGRQAEPPEEDPARDAGQFSTAVFTGWYVDQTAENAYNFTSAVMEDLTLYAGWQIEERYLVTLNANGGQLAEGGESKEYIIAKGELFGKPGNPVREGFLFRGWFTDEDCLTPYDFTGALDRNLSLYAGWTPEGTRAVVFDANGGTVTINGQTAEKVLVVVNEGETLPEPGENDAVKAAAGSTTFTLSGWQTDDNAIWDFSAPVTENMILTANWEARYFTFPTVGGAYEIDSLTVLEALRDLINAGDNQSGKTFFLTKDIYLPADWVAIGEKMDGGSSAKPHFAGVFDGGGYTIYLDNRQTEPLFGGILGGTVRNLNIVGDTLRGMRAGLAYYCSGNIENCSVQAKMYDCAAGFVYVSNSISIKNSVLKSGSYLQGGQAMGGFVAIVRSESTSSTYEFINCVVEPGVTIVDSGSGYPIMAGYGIGGIAGYAIGDIKNCFVGADIQSVTKAGGIIGNGNTVGSVSIESCAWYGSHIDGTPIGRSTNSYYGVRGAETNESLSDSYAAFLPSSDFESGRAAYLLDGGEEEHRGEWTHNLEGKYPMPGQPSFYPITLSASGGGSLTIETENGAEPNPCYRGAGATVALSATPDDYENEPYGPQYAYVLKALEARDKEENQLPCSLESGTLLLPEGLKSEVSVSAIFELRQIGLIEEPKEEEDKPHGGGSGSGHGGGAGTGEGEGDAAIGQGEGEGLGNEEGDGTGLGGGEPAPETTSETPFAPSEEAASQPVLAPQGERNQLESEEEEPADEARLESGGSLAGGTTGPETEGEPEPQPEPEPDEELTIFEIVKKTARENPLLTLAVAAVLLGIIAVSATVNYRKYKNNRYEVEERK